MAAHLDGSPHKIRLARESRVRAALCATKREANARVVPKRETSRLDFGDKANGCRGICRVVMVMIALLNDS